MAFSKGARAAALMVAAWAVLATPAGALGQALNQNPPIAHPPHQRFYPPPHLPTAIGVDQKKGLVGDADAVIAPKDKDKDKDKGPNHEIVSKDGRFKLDFDKVEITDLVQSISDMTGKLFIVPENIHGKITIIGPKHGTEWVTAAEAYAAFLAALDSTNLAIYPMGKYNKIVEKRDARRKAVPTFTDPAAVYPDTEQYITRLFRLKHVDPDTVNGLVAELIGPDGMSRPFQPDLLIIADQALNMHRLETIIEQIDVPAGGDEVKIIQVTFGSAQDLSEKLQNIFQDKNKKPGAGHGLSISIPNQPGHAESKPAGGADEKDKEEAAVNLTRVIPDERTNKLVVIASPSSFAKIEALVRQLDVPVPGEGQIHVYYLENAEAEKVSTTLTNLISGISQGRKGAGGAAPAGGAPAANQSVFEGQVKISPDKATNSLVIVGTGTDYANLTKVIERLDKPQRQVFVEAVIMEVNINSELDFGGAAHYIATPTINGQQVPIPIGAEPFAIGKGINSLLGISGLASLGGFLTGLQGPANSTIGQALGIAIPSFSVMVQALETNGATNVISTPHILTTNNEEAEITVGQNVPFQSGFSLGGLGGLGALAGAAGSTTSSTSGLGALGGLGIGSLPIGQIQRQNVELKLKLKPQINSGDFVRLTVDESTEEIASTDPILGPTTSKRSAKTVIVAKDQETVVIGGLMQDRVIKSSNKTPVLGDIPLLGWLFRYDTTTKQKVNLLLFLTPYIIRDASDFRTIFERKMKEREEFVERFYGDSVNYHVPIDYDRKTGPLGAMTVNLRREQNKIENGGSGQDSGERPIGPKRARPLFGPGAVAPDEPGSPGSGMALPPPGAVDPGAVAPSGAEAPPAAGTAPAPGGGETAPPPGNGAAPPPGGG